MDKNFQLPTAPRYGAKWRKPKLIWGNPELAEDWVHIPKLVGNYVAKLRGYDKASNSTYPYYSVGYWSEWLSGYYNKPITINAVYINRERWLNQSYITLTFGIRLS